MTSSARVRIDGGMSMTPGCRRPRMWAKAERDRGGGAVAKGLLALLTPETVEPPRTVHAHLADAVTAARWLYPTPNSRCVRILTAAYRSPRSRGASCSDSRCNRAFWCASTTRSPGRARTSTWSSPILASSALRHEGPKSSNRFGSKMRGSAAVMRTTGIGCAGRPAKSRWCESITMKE